MEKTSQESRKKAYKGKFTLQFEVECFMYDLIVCGSQDEELFDHYLITLKWNLISRSNDIIRYIIKHTEWRSDVLILF